MKTIEKNKLIFKNWFKKSEKNNITGTQVINLIIIRFGYNRYLEIGVRNPKTNFNKINCRYKVGVDPVGEPTFKGTSDDFFKQNKDIFDIIFIDGLHLEEQTDKDIQNSLNALSPDGTIVMHDCNPTTYDRQVEIYRGGNHAWNGTVWKSYVKLRMSNKNLKMCVIDTDEGLGIIRKGQQNIFKNKIEKLTYDFFDKNRNSLLNLITIDKFMENKKNNSSF